MRGAHMKRLLTTAVSMTFLAMGLTGATPARATSPTVVTIQFDDRTADQFQAMAILRGPARWVCGGTTPPLDAFATRTPPNPKQGTTLATIEGYVTAAEDNGGGWVQLVFHHVCNQCDAYSITPENLEALAAWLEPRAQ